MNTVICPHCKKTIELSEALTHQLKEQIVKQQEEKHKLEIEKARKESLLAAEKNIKERIERELTTSKTANRKLEQEMQKLKRQQEENELRRKEAEAKIREDAMKEASKNARLEKLELEKKLKDTQEALDTAQRKAKQSSQQLQGEVLELDLEDGLKQAFPYDELKPVPKGVRGGDIIQEVRNKFGNIAGSILWEAKRQKDWNKIWLVKLREDMRKINASDCILVTDILPNNVKIYDRIDNVWVTSYEYAFKLAYVVRLGLLNLAITRSSASHNDEQLKILYRIITSDSFRHMFEARDEIIINIRKELDSEIASTERRWTRQKDYIDRLTRNNNQLYNELQTHIPSLKPLKGKSLELESGTLNTY